MGTAAYKTVELDTFLSGKATQYRELQDNESDLFRSYFLTSLGGTYVPRGIVILIGGVESGFRHVIPPSFENYSPILLRIHNYGTTQINIVNGAITEDDVYILDAGLTVYIYAGSLSSHFERLRGEYTAKEIQLNRKNTQIVRLHPDDEEMKQFDSYIDQHISSITEGITLYTINETGTTKLITGSISRQMFDSKNAYVLETPTGAFMWVGKESTLNEMMSAWKVAFKSTPLTTPLVSVREGQEPETFFQYVSK